MKYSTNLLIILVNFLLIICLKEENPEVTINIGYLNEKPIGRKGTVVISAYSSYFNIIDTSKTVCFKSKFTNGGNSYDVDCGFWKAENENLYIFCNVDENIPAGDISFNFDGTQKINYKDYTITLKQERTLSFKKYDQDIIDLYSDKQLIEEGKNDYYLKFKIVSYNQEHLKLSHLFILDCNQENNELTCHITKSQFESMLIKDETSFQLSYINNIEFSNHLPLIPEINIKYNIKKKTDIFIGITKLVENVTEAGTTFAY